MITLSKRPTCGHVIRRQALVVPLRDEGVIGQKREHVGTDVAYKEMGGGRERVKNAFNGYTSDITTTTTYTSTSLNLK